ncbi:MAG TPA: hypothetical protein P5560_07815 [Thermotogota bacterium]|nr:hypothetical protein [Thermotogota bacterium]
MRPNGNCLKWILGIVLVLVFSGMAMGMTRTIAAMEARMVFDDTRISSVLVRYEPAPRRENAYLAVYVFNRSHVMEQMMVLTYPQFLGLNNDMFDLSMITIRWRIEKAVEEFLEGNETLLDLTGIEQGELLK